MTLSKKLLGVWALTFAFTAPQAAFAADAFEDPSSVTTADASAETLPGEGLQRSQDPAGKTMEEFVAEAKSGFPDKFTDGEVMAVMSASRMARDSDRELSRKLERIAAKMSSI